MTSATQHGERILAAIIPDRRDLLDHALRHLTPEHFPHYTHRNLYTLLERYANVTGAIITREALDELLRRSGADAGKILAYQETYDLLAATAVDEAGFRWSLQQIRELAAERATSDALTSGMEILTRGVEDERGETHRGHVDARLHILQRFADIDRDLAMQEAPEGDVRHEGDDILADYAARKAARENGRSLGIEFGIAAVDAKINGIQRGDFGLILGYTSEGKTVIVVQLAWHAVTQQQQNTVILTTETLRTQVRRRLMARHSCVDSFGIEGGLNSRQIKDGTLSPQQERQLEAVVADFTRNPGYGRCYLVQVPRAATIGYVESKLVRIQRMFPIDLVILDSLYLLRPERRRNTDREELSGMCKEAKQLATTFNGGNGIPFITPWQANRVAREQAERTGSYSTQAASETAEAPNSADWIISVLAPLDNDKRVCTAKMQALKNRDGERANSIEVQIDYATNRIFSADERRQDFFGGGSDLLAF